MLSRRQTTVEDSAGHVSLLTSLERSKEEKACTGEVVNNELRWMTAMTLSPSGLSPTEKSKINSIGEKPR